MNIGLLLVLATLPAVAQNWTGTSGGWGGSGISGPVHTSSGTANSGGNSGGRSSNNNNNNNNRNSASQSTPSFHSDRKHLKEFDKISKMGSTDAALAAWLKFAKETGWPSAWFNYANTASNLRQYSVAVGVFKQLTSYCPNDARICGMAKQRALLADVDLGDDYYRQGNIASAEAAYREARDMDTNDPHPWCALAYTARQQSRYDEAFENAKSCASHTPDNDSYRSYAVKTFYAMWEQTEYSKAQEIIGKGYIGWTADALPHLWGAVKYENVTGEASYNARAELASVLHDQGLDSLAETQADIALLQNPGNTYAQSVLDRIHPMDVATGNGHYPNACTSIVPGEDGTKTTCK